MICPLYYNVCWRQSLVIPLCTHTHTHTTGLPDPFAKVVVEDSGQCHCTEPLKATLDPKWNQHYDL